MTDILAIIAAREASGDFAEVSDAAQSLRRFFRALGWDQMTPVMQEALDMSAAKLARILCGDPHHKDNWVDLAGYAELVVLSLEETKV